MFNPKPKTVADAISNLLQSISNLEKVADMCNERCSKHSQEISRLEGLLETDQRELKKAERIAAKLREITEAE